jgi:putative Ca2+/H+ antiporter (TMEM165/GDT1 family)
MHLHLLPAFTLLCTSTCTALAPSPSLRLRVAPAHVAALRASAPRLGAAPWKAAAVGGALTLLAPESAHGAGLSVPAAFIDSSLGGAFVQASSLIFVSELGDKVLPTVLPPKSTQTPPTPSAPPAPQTFFIAALLAARGAKLLTFAGCAGALAFMTVVSVAIGQIFHQVPDSFTRGLPLDDYVAIVSFLYFGARSILDALALEEDGAGIAEERKEAEETVSAIDAATGGWPLVLEACTLTLAAEVGDRSQLATIALGAAQNPFGVALGGTLGHCCATGLAVLGGSFISKYFSERVIGLVGGTLFLVFAFTTAFGLF